MGRQARKTDLEKVQATLGARIRELRLRRGLSQEGLATRCDMSQKYLSELERGRKAPSFETLASIAHQGFEVRLSDLLFGVDADAAADVTHVDALLAGRPASAQKAILRAIELLLAAGATVNDASK